MTSRYTLSRSVAALAIIATTTGSAFAETEIGGDVIIEQTADKVAALAGRNLDFQTVELQDAKITGDLVIKQKATKAAFLAGRNAKVQSVVMK